MLPRGGRATDDTTRGVEAEGAARGELEADDSTRVGGRTTRGKRAADDRTTQQEGGAHDVVGGGGDDGNCGGDSGGGGWSSEVGGAPTSMPGTAALPWRRPSFFAKSFLIGTLRKVVKYTWNYIINI